MKAYFFLSTFALFGWATDDAAKLKLAQADTLFKERADLTKVAGALASLDQALVEAASDDMKVEVLVHQSYTLYFLGTRQTNKADKIKSFAAGDTKAREALKVKEYADGLYWSAANLGRWGETNGILQSLGKKDELVAILKKIFESDTLSNEAGDTYESYGADRILGRLYFKLPSFAGGSRSLALQHLRRSYEKGGNYALTAIYLAEALGNGAADEKAEAKQILDKLLSNDPKTFNPDRIPETEEEFALARKLKSELGL